MAGPLKWAAIVEASENYISPTLISGLTADATLLKDEIFGPILPLKTFTEIEEGHRLHQRW